MANSLNVGFVQCQSVHDVSSNVESILKVIHSFDDLDSLDLISLPENSLLFPVDGLSENDYIKTTDNCFEPFVSLAKTNKLCVHFGGLALLVDGKKYNATVWIDASGVISVPYKKIHLFDVDYKDLTISESNSFESGNCPSVVHVNGWSIGLSICYDLRFSELYNYYAKKDVELFLIPAAFFEKTGRDHWDTLLKARSIESQCFVVSSAQVGEHTGGSGKVRKTYGHSQALSPWGGMLIDLKKESWSFGSVRLDKEMLVDIRSRMPMKKHRQL